MVRKSFFAFIVIVVTLSTGFVSAQQFKLGFEPDGFGGILWGADISTLEEMRFVFSRDIGGSLPISLWDFERGTLKKQIRVEIYEKPGDDRHLYGVPVQSIRYGFWKGKFCEVTVTARGQDNWKVLKHGIFERYGKGTKQALPMSMFGDEQPEWNTWMGSIAEMELIYFPLAQSFKFWIGSIFMRDQAFEEAIE